MLALQQCQKQRAQLQSDKASYQHRVETMLLEHPPGTINEEDVAAALFMSKRSLARRLAEESTGFRQIREQLLAGQAANYLRESSLSVEAIATLLGYHDSANFRRAFKRWFAVTPADYRES
jgi:AraC-like DNA-binding protein